MITIFTRNKSISNGKKKTTRHVLLKIRKSFAFKLLIISFTVLFSFSVAIYYLEKNYIIYKYEDGKRVEDSDESSNIRKFKDSVWWAFVTSTTVGYGDFYPKSFAGRLTGVLLMFFGITVAGIITGNIASYLVERQLKEGRGLKELKLKNHFIICGWKRDMADVLYDIMEKNKSFLASEIVLINTATPDEIENLRSDSKFSQINYIHGDYIDERVLKRANIKQASRVIVFADRMVNGSAQEIDSRTVMAIITIKSISRAIYTCAELLDSKFERYLTSSNCDEVILSTNYNRALIANASAGSGISHVISDLLDVNTDISINTIQFPDKYIGKSYNDLFDFYIGKDRSILIGILENTGNFYERKKEAIREAQKTPDISKLVDNLNYVKNLMANQPIMNPPPDYTVKKYSRAIVVEGRTYSSQKKLMEDTSHADI